jgi:ABC-type Fe3+-siderophore transport system permease subunit
MVGSTRVPRAAQVTADQEMMALRRRVAGAALTVVGILLVLFAPVRATDACAVVTDRGGVYGVSGVCGNFSANSLAGLVNWPAGWEKLFVPMVAFGTALAATGVVLLLKRRRSRRSPLVG